MTETARKLGVAAQHLQKGNSSACQDICNELLELQPDLLAAFNLRGLAAAQSGMHEAAILDLARVWPAQPENRQAALWLGRLLRLRGRYNEALPALKAAINEPALEIDARYELALVLTRTRQNTLAMEQYKRLLLLEPDHANATANLAFLLERANRLEEAETTADRAISIAPQNFMAQLSKATLLRRRGKVTEARQILESFADKTLSPLNRSVVLNQLAQCLDTENSYQEAFRTYQQSNETLRKHHPLGIPVADGSYGLETLSRFGQWLSVNPPGSWSAGIDKHHSEPVFLVGFPRSGTTLLDQALSAHPEIEVLEEFEFFDDIRRQWVDGNRLEALVNMSTEQLHTTRAQYLSAASARRTRPNRICVVDKLPLNLVYLFLIHRLFPHAKIIFLMRDPRDACLSCFFQAFDLQGAMPYFLRLEDTAKYYDAVMQLSQQTLRNINNPLSQPRYEDLVTDFEGSMRKIIDFLGLDWVDEVLNYRENALSRMIDTPSYQQVTRPLYQSSIGKWRHYEKQMEPMNRFLGQWVKSFAYPEN